MDSEGGWEDPFFFFFTESNFTNNPVKCFLPTSRLNVFIMNTLMRNLNAEEDEGVETIIVLDKLF